VLILLFELEIYRAPASARRAAGSGSSAGCACSATSAIEKNLLDRRMHAP
jgi:hypothetical protein